MTEQKKDPFQFNGTIKWGTAAFFLLLHLLPITLIWTGIQRQDFLAAFILYVMMAFGITAGYHRYFAHKTFQTNRVVQFFFAMLGSLTFQRVLPWAAQHRHHHRSSDTEKDLHSPVRGLLWSHLLWMFQGRDYKAIVKTVPDLMKYPELRWINRWCYLVPATAIGICYAIGGWSMVVGGFVLAVVFTWHVMLSINSLTHLMGKRRYVTTDTSRNSFLLAILAFGEGWHNNHHYFSTSTRQGFKWWEIDISYYLLKLLSVFGLVKKMRSIPEVLAKRNLIADGHFDVGEARAADLRMKFLGRPKLIPQVLIHVLSIAGAVAVTTLLVVFAALNGNVHLIVGGAIFGSTLLAFFILHIWKFGVSRNNLYLLVAGAVTPLFVMLGRVTPVAWAVLATVIVTVGMVILARSIRQRILSLEIVANVLIALAVAFTLLVFWKGGFIEGRMLYYCIAAVMLFAGAYRYRYAFEVMHLKPLFQLVLLAGSTSYFFFLNHLIG
jgi:stearoyl-CoA desaturase (delta-9 desaturase)